MTKVEAATFLLEVVLAIVTPVRDASVRGYQFPAPIDRLLREQRRARISRFLQAGDG